jgi:hypothetical protein
MTTTAIAAGEAAEAAVAAVVDAALEVQETQTEVIEASSEAEVARIEAEGEAAGAVAEVQADAAIAIAEASNRDTGVEECRTRIAAVEGIVLVMQGQLASISELLAATIEPLIPPPLASEPEPEPEEVLEIQPENNESAEAGGHVAARTRYIRRLL